MNHFFRQCDNTTTLSMVHDLLLHKFHVWKEDNGQYRSDGNIKIQVIINSVNEEIKAFLKEDEVEVTPTLTVERLQLANAKPIQDDNEVGDDDGIDNGNVSEDESEWDLVADNSENESSEDTDDEDVF